MGIREWNEILFPVNQTNWKWKLKNFNKICTLHKRRTAAVEAAAAVAAKRENRPHNYYVDARRNLSIHPSIYPVKHSSGRTERWSGVSPVVVWLLVEFHSNNISTKCILIRYFRQKKIYLTLFSAIQAKTDSFCFLVIWDGTSETCIWIMDPSIYTNHLNGMKRVIY